MIINILFSSIIFFMLVPQYTFLSSIHPGHKNWIEVMGAILVFLGCTLSSLLEMFKNKVQIKCYEVKDKSQDECN